MNGDPKGDFSLGKKIEPRAIIKPDWRKRPDLGPHIYESTKDGKLRNAPPVPDGPMHPNPWDLWAKHLADQLEGAP